MPIKALLQTITLLLSDIGGLSHLTLLLATEGAGLSTMTRYGDLQLTNAPTKLIADSIDVNLLQKGQQGPKRAKVGQSSSEKAKIATYLLAGAAFEPRRLLQQLLGLPSHKLLLSGSLGGIVATAAASGLLEDTRGRIVVGGDGTGRQGRLLMMRGITGPN